VEEDLTTDELDPALCTFAAECRGRIQSGLR